MKLVLSKSDRLLVGRALTEAGFDLLAPVLSFNFVSVAADTDRLVQNEIAPGEWERDLKAVPAFETDLRLGVAGHRDDRQSSDLGEGDDAVLDDITRTLWTIRRDGQVISPFREAGQFQQGLRAAAAAGAADLFDSEPAQDGSEEGAVLAGADQCRELSGMAPVDDH